ncbi:hypothetical protein JHK85_030381 [Glycine max]|nr:hypothetical protein JHK85_030381 [Glycine max]
MNLALVVNIIQTRAMLSRLEIVIGQLKEMGYVPELSLALYDTEVEHKEDQLLHHSKKMALVFAIMNEGIKIMKNIRICVDCHNFMKLASYLFQKEIAARDSNCFHHFKYAACSCNDYCLYWLWRFLESQLGQGTAATFINSPTERHSNDK